METITFYSYKGGTGRTLVVANVARYLSRFDQSVVVLDFDLEAPGLHYKLNLEKPDEGLPVERGVVDYFHACLHESNPPESLREFFLPLELSATEKGPIYLMAAGNVPSVEYWRKLSQVNWHEFLYARGAVGIPRFLELKERIRDEFQPDFLLIDARTGITEIGGLATAVLPDKVVCLLLNNRENLDGARAVLRSLRRADRPPDAEPVKMIPVLARIPALEDIQEESQIVDRVRAFLSEPAEDLKDTLDVSDLFVLHSERDLEVKESLRIGGDKSPDESVLLRDYLRLFLRLIEPEIIRPHLSPLIEQAEKLAFDEPDRAQRELELLAEYGHPDAYEELLKFYRLRKVDGNIILRAGQRFWELARPEVSQVLWRCVKENFTERGPRVTEKLDLSFVEEVWRTAGADDVQVGCDLAESYDNFQSRDHAADLLLQLVDRTDPAPKAVFYCLRQLRRVERWSNAKALIDAHGDVLADDPKFFEEWARYVIGSGDTCSAEKLLDSPMLSSLMRRSVDVVYEVLLVAGRKKEAESTLNGAVERALTGGEFRELMELAEVFERRGRMEEFEQRLAERVPPGFLDEMRHRMRRRFR